MNFDFLKNVDKKIIILAVSLLVLVILMASASTIKSNRRKAAKQAASEYTTISIEGTPAINNVQFSNIKIKQYSETNATITATVTNTTSKPIDAFTISIKKSTYTATALVPSLEAHASVAFSTNVSIDFSGSKKAKSSRKKLELSFQ